MLLVPPNAKGLDMSKFCNYQCNNARKKYGSVFTWSGYKALKGTLQALQDSVLSQLIDTEKLEDIEQTVDTNQVHY